MKPLTKLNLVGLLLAAFYLQPSIAQAQGTAFTYQGRLNDGVNVANGRFDLRFAVYDAATAGTQQGNLVTNSATAVSNGLFIVTLDFGYQFPGATRWLEIAVRTNGAASFFILNPRQALTPVPYAITSGSVISGGLAAGTYGNALTLNNAANSINGTFTGNGLNVTNVNAVSLNGITSAGFWKTNGNIGANPTNGAFIGTADNLPLEFKANGGRALRLEPNGNSPNVIGGFGGNVVSNANYGAFVGGGGSSSTPNLVGGNYAAVLGGLGNTAYGYASLAAGNASSSSGWASTAMGYHTTASGDFSTALGVSSMATGPNSTAMGSSTTAGGLDSIAMGHRAQAVHDSTFVWADTGVIGTGDFASTTNNEFSVRALNGVRIQTDRGIHLNGDNRPLITRDFDPFAANAPSYKSGIGRWGLFMEPFNLVLGIPGDDAPGRNFQVGKYNTDGNYTALLTVDQGGKATASSFMANTSVGINTAFLLGNALCVNGDARIDARPAGWNEGLAINCPTNMAAGGGFGGIHFHSTAQGQGFDANSIKWSEMYNYAPEIGNAVGGGLAFIHNNNYTALYLGPSGNVGVGTTAPLTALHVKSSSPDCQVSIESPALYDPAGAANSPPVPGRRWSVQSSSPLAGFQLADSFQIIDRTIGASRVLIDTSGKVGIGTTSPAYALDVAGSCGATTFVNTSDRNAKENFQPVDAQEVLNKVASLPVMRWNYKEDGLQQHLGPMAQDFYAAFKVGPDDKHITTVDEGGVALAAIQGLNEKLEARSQRLEAENADLKARLEKLEQLLLNRK